jgi:two-component system sensor histidine kinase RegB
MSMIDRYPDGFGPRLRLETLVRLRWLAMTGQAAAVLITHFGPGFRLPLLWCGVVILASALMNVALRVRYGRNARLDRQVAAGALAWDVAQLSALLYLTGGLQNPFAALFLAPVMISAVSLDPWLTTLIGLFVAACAGALTLHHMPLPWWPGETLELPLLYRVGGWIAIVVSAGFIGVYAWKVADEARKLSNALAATELILEREQHLTQLDGLAAAAAHELGTPLATIVLIARELQAQTPKSSPMADDLRALSEEVARCRVILGKLTSLGADSGPGALYGGMSLSQLLKEAVEPHHNFGPELMVEARGEGPEPIVPRNPGLLYGLGNLVENAVDFAKSRVVVAARWSPDRVDVVIEDDGPGFSAQVLARVGEPYVTTRADRRAKSDEGSGLGLGLFIAKTLLEKSGASVAIANAAAPAHGARIVIRWPRSALDRAQE